MRRQSEQWGGGTLRPSPKATTRWTPLWLLLGALGLQGCAHSPLPPLQTSIQCQVDPQLRQPIERPPLPSESSQEAMAVFSIQQEMTISRAELQRNYAVKALDNCNQANALLTQALAKPQGKPWWKLWG